MGLGTGFEAAGETVGRSAVALPGSWLLGFVGRGSCSSALRFAPPLTFPRTGMSRDTGAGWRSLFFEVEEDAGGAGGCDGDAEDGLPVWMDERIESRN